MKNDRTDRGFVASDAKLIADYAMIMDMVGQLAGFATVREQVERIFGLLELVCAPENMCYLTMEGDIPGELFCRPEGGGSGKTDELLRALEDGDYRVLPGDEGFIFRVRDKEKKTVAIIAVERVMEPALMKHYLNLVLNIRSVLALAIANSLMYQNEIRSRATIQSYATQLEVLHDIGLTLNRETDESRLMASVLDGAARLTDSGMGAVIQKKQLKVRIINKYFAPWCQERGLIGKDVAGLHATLTRLVEKRDADVVRISGREFGQAGFIYPGSHASIRELLLGALRDTQGRVVGHFLLSDKRQGASYTKADEEIISLLTAQASVALTSAKNFEREHRVAEALQNALLPSAPARADLDVGLLYQAAGHSRIGGDFYEVIELGGDRLAFAVGDVCGKGLQAATYNAMMKYLLRAFIREEEDPGACLTRLNAAVRQELPDDRFVTMALAVVDTLTGEISFSSAGHPYPILSSEFGARELYLTPTLPLGVMEDYTYPCAAEKMEAGDSVLMYTDGITEARSPKGAMFGQKRLLQELVTNTLPAQEMIEKLQQQVLEHADGNLKDDMAMLIVGLSGNGGDGAEELRAGAGHLTDARSAATLLSSDVSRPDRRDRKQNRRLRAC